jgi:hypothetical protein
VADLDWPVALRGVTETVVTTRGPEDRWNAAALGIHAPTAEDDGQQAARARTWGRTRTRRNFDRRGRGYVQFVSDPELFARAALEIVEVEEPLLAAADAWAEVTVEDVAEGTTDGTDWVDWALTPVETAIERRTVPTTNRGYGAVVEATVAASRLDASGYDRAALVERLEYLASVVERCGGPAEQRAFGVIRDASDW